MKLTYTLRQLLLSVAIILSAAGMTFAKPAIAVGNHDLLPNTPGQMIQIFVSDLGPLPNNGQGLQGENFIMDINHDTPGGGIITAVDLLTGTIFDGNNTGQRGVPAPPGTTAIASNPVTLFLAA